MNRLLSILILGLLFFISCEKEIDGPYLQYGANPVIFSPTANASYVLTEDKSKDLFANIAWSDAGFGFPAQVTYEIQMGYADAQGGDTKTGTFHFVVE